MYETGKNADNMVEIHEDPIKLPKDRLLRAIEAFNEKWGLPWKYSLVVFKPGAPDKIKRAWKSIYIDISELFIGGNFGAIIFGSYVIGRVPEIITEMSIDDVKAALDSMIMNNEELIMFFENEFEKNELIDNTLQTIKELNSTLKSIINSLKPKFTSEAPKELQKACIKAAALMKKLGEHIKNIEDIPKSIHESLQTKLNE